MKSFPDTSFLCALYRNQPNSHLADKYISSYPGSLPVSQLVLLEFRQSVRLQTWLYKNDRNRGYPSKEAKIMLEQLYEDLRTRTYRVLPVDWSEVHMIVENLSQKYTRTHGNRMTDIFHVATAMYLGISEFLTFDARQSVLAQSEGLQVPLPV